MPLVVKGFSKQNIISPAQIETAIIHLPKHHISSLECIAFDPSRFYQRSYADPRPINYAAAGEYSRLPINHILIFNFRSQNEFLHILYHEIGHHVFKHVLDSFQRKSWVMDVSRNGEYVTEYAKTNASEDFAECYSIYLSDRERLAPIQLKYKFIENLMFNE